MGMKHSKETVSINGDFQQGTKQNIMIYQIKEGQWQMKNHKKF
jgi:hypothetical protein